MPNSLIFIFPTTVSLLWAGLISAIAIISIISDLISRSAQKQELNLDVVHHSVEKESPERELTINRL